MGRGCSYLAFARAQGAKILAPPDLIRLDGRTGVPTAVRLAQNGESELLGDRALASWVQDPEEVSLGFTEELSPQGGMPLQAARSFLKFLNYRLVEVLGPDAASPREGAVTALATSAGWSDEHASLLAETVEQAGFPLVHLVPEPLAAAVHYFAATPREAEYFLVIDWGSQSLGLSTVEYVPVNAGPTVIDYVELPLGGVWFDTILNGWLAERLQTEFSDEDSRALALFARQFKEDASTAFAEGRAEHVQYCVIPPGMPPTRISVSRAEFDNLFADSRAQFVEAVAEAPRRVGFRPDDYDQVILAGGAASMYFAGPAATAALGRTPVVPRNPEETIARGLVFWAARQASPGAQSPTGA
jgi:molecular chaperone DnaK (HSP70)